MPRTSYALKIVSSTGGHATGSNRRLPRWWSQVVKSGGEGWGRLLLRRTRLRRRGGAGVVRLVELLPAGRQRPRVPAVEHDDSGDAEDRAQDAGDVDGGPAVVEGHVRLRGHDDHQVG